MTLDLFPRETDGVSIATNGASRPLQSLPSRFREERGPQMGLFSARAMVTQPQSQALQIVKRYPQIVASKPVIRRPKWKPHVLACCLQRNLPKTQTVSLKTGATKVRTFREVKPRILRMVGCLVTDLDGSPTQTNVFPPGIPVHPHEDLLSFTRVQSRGSKPREAGCAWHAPC